MCYTSKTTSRLPLRKMTEKEIEQASQEFWEEVEAEAAKLEISVDYYLAEFY